MVQRPWWWCSVHGDGAWCILHSAWCMMHGALCVVHDAWLRNAWCMVHDAWRMVHDTSYNKDLMKKFKWTFTRIPHWLYNDFETRMPSVLVFSFVFIHVKENTRISAVGFFLWFSNGFPMAFHWFSYGFPIVTDGFFIVFLWFPFFLWFLVVSL